MGRFHKFHKVTVTLSDYQYAKLRQEVKDDVRLGVQMTMCQRVRELLAKAWGDMK